MYGKGQTIIGGGTLKGPSMGYAPSETTASAPTATDRIRGELESAINRVHSSIDRVQGFANRMGGDGCGAKSGPAESPNRMGAVGVIQDRVDQLHASLSTLESELERLSAI